MMSKDKKIQITYELGGNVSTPIIVTPGIPHIIVLKRRRMTVDILEAEDVSFRYNSALMLPTVIPAVEYKNTGTPNFELYDETFIKQQKVAGLSVIKGIFRYYHLCQTRNEIKKLLITGHTDSVASDNYNKQLSLKRANVVLWIILGGKENRDAFADTVNYNHHAKDEQHVLKWIAKTLSWPDVDPGKVDGEYRWKTVNAIIAFKRNLKNKKKFPPERYENITLPNDLPDLINDLRDGAHIGLHAWKVIFEIYQAELQLALMKDGLDIVELRSQLQWVSEEKKAVGCGETWPLEARGIDNYKSQTNRRVEILFYDPDELMKPLPCKDSDCVEDECHIFKNIDRYNPDGGGKETRLAWRYIPIDDEGFLDEFIIRLAISPETAKKMNYKFRLFNSGKYKVYDQVKTIKDDMHLADNYIDLVFEGVYKYLTYSLEVAPGDGGAPYLVVENYPYSYWKEKE